MSGPPQPDRQCMIQPARQPRAAARRRTPRAPRVAEQPRGDARVAAVRTRRGGGRARRAGRARVPALGARAAAPPSSSPARRSRRAAARARRRALLRGEARLPVRRRRARAARRPGRAAALARSCAATPRPRARAPRTRSARARGARRDERALAGRSGSLRRAPDASRSALEVPLLRGTHSDRRNRDAVTARSASPACAQPGLARDRPLRPAARAPRQAEAEEQTAPPGDLAPRHRRATT